MRSPSFRLAVVAFVFVVAVALPTVTGAGAATPVVEAGHITMWSETNGGNSSDQEYTRAEAVKVAERYDMISALRWTFRDHTDAMRAANPDFVLMTYQNGGFARSNEGSAFPSSWYLRDAKGRKVTSVKWGNYLMNPAIQGWQDQVIAECREYVAFAKSDGCHLDDLGWGNHISANLSAPAINPATGRPYTEAEWFAAVESLLRRVDNKLSGEMLIGGNGINHGSRYFGTGGGSKKLLAQMDYGVAEGFMRGEVTGINDFRREDRWKKDVDMLVDAGNSGMSVATMTKIWIGASSSQINQWRNYATASFLLGTDGSHTFFFNAEGPGKPPAPHPLDNIDLGQPDGPYAKIDGVYQRSFSKGRVLVNPTGSGRTVDLGGTYTTIYGKSKTSVYLGPNTGIILLSSSTRSATTTTAPSTTTSTAAAPSTTTSTSAPSTTTVAESTSTTALKVTASAPRECMGEPATIIGTTGDDVLRGTSGRDVISAGPGNDIIFGYNGDDLICGHRGNDHIEGGAGRDDIRGGRGHDTLLGGYGHDKIFGDDGDDLLRAQHGADRLFGGAGSDRCGLGSNADDTIMSSCTNIYG